MGVHEEQAAFFAGAQWARDTIMESYRVSLAEAKEEAARRYPIPTSVVKISAVQAELSPEAVPMPFPHQLTHAQREGQYRDKLLEAAAGNPEFSALLWGVSPMMIWTTDGMEGDFKAIAFEAPYVQVQNRVTGQEGTLQFTARPRFYYGWVPS